LGGILGGGPSVKLNVSPGYPTQGKSLIPKHALTVRKVFGIQEPARDRRSMVFLRFFVEQGHRVAFGLANETKAHVSQNTSLSIPEMPDNVQGGACAFNLEPLRMRRFHLPIFVCLFY
jgi:hypothetical protein